MTSLPYGIVTTQQPIPQLDIQYLLAKIDQFKEERNRIDSLVRQNIHNLLVKGHSIYFISSVLQLSYSDTFDIAYSLKPIPGRVWDVIKIYCEKIKNEQGSKSTSESATSNTD